MAKSKITIGQKVRKARLLNKMSYEDLAKESGLSTITIRDLEKDVRTSPNLDTIAQIAKATNVKLGWFYDNLLIKEDKKK